MHDLVEVGVGEGRIRRVLGAGVQVLAERRGRGAAQVSALGQRGPTGLDVSGLCGGF